MSGNWFPLVRAWATQGPYTGVLDVLSTADPAYPLVPGAQFQIAMTVTPSGGAFRTYGYILGESLEDGVVVEDLQGLRKLPNGRYAVFASGDEPATATLVVRVLDEGSDGAVVVPRAVVGVMPFQGDKLSASSGIEDKGYYVRRHSIPARRLDLHPGEVVSLPAGGTEGLRVTGVTLARYGMLGCSPDGTVTYQAPHSFHGYDRFVCTYEDRDGHMAEGHVVVRVGDLGASPGALGAVRG
ncbi:Ig-like domain-containing protein [Streptomyces sp. NPDC058289]|uniref:Ig-like domain-containing protein n=1 Tax=Streptomyces sp. NPDC058289 TaxID=3346425 RepID=UPI0036EE7CB7